MKEKYIQGIYNEYAGLLDQRRADLEVLVSMPVGIGDHGNLSAEIKKTLEEVEKYSSLVETMKSLFGSTGQPETPEVPEE